MPKPLFDDAVQASRSGSPAGPAQRPATPANAPGWAEPALDGLGLVGADRDRVKRMAAQIRDADAAYLHAYGRSALDEANAAAAAMAGMVSRAADVGADAYLADLARRLAPPSDWVSRIAHVVYEPIALAPVEARLRSMIGQAQQFMADAGRAGPDMPRILDRIRLQAAALAVAGPALSDPEMQRVARFRKGLLEAGMSGLQLNQGMLKRQTEQAKRWVEMLETALYVTIPNWRSLHR